MQVERVNNVVDAEVVEENHVERVSERKKYTNSLRAFADWLDANPTVATPVSHKLYVFPTTEQMADYARVMGKARKSADESYFNLTKDFLPAIQYEPTWYRNQVCERVVVGQREEERDVVQVVGKEKVIVDVVEWKCPKVLAPKLGEGSDND